MTQCLKDLPRCDRAKLAAKLGTDAESLRGALALLERLDPRPAAAFTDAPVEYVVPDVIARRERGVWRVTLNPAGQPSLRLNRHYERLARGRGAAQSYLREHLREARWLLNSLQSRADTMLRVSECIVREQTGFLEFGPEAMRPLTLSNSPITTQIPMATIADRPQPSRSLSAASGSKASTSVEWLRVASA